MIPMRCDVRVWIATGRTDMRRGMNGLALQVQQGVKRDPHAGDLFVFRGRRGDLIKIRWHDGLGMRGSKLLDQLELQLEELEASATELELAATAKSAEDGPVVTSFTRKKPVRAPLPAHLPRERLVILAPAACPCCGGKPAKLDEDVTETLEVVPRQWKVVQTVREKFTCRRCAKITQPPAPFHTIARGRAGASLLAMILYAKYGHHQPLSRQSESFAREGIELDVSTMADWVGACTAALAPLVELIRRHVLGAPRLHGDDTTVPVLVKGKKDNRPGVGLCPR